MKINKVIKNCLNRNYDLNIVKSAVNLFFITFRFIREKHWIFFGVDSDIILCVIKVEGKKWEYSIWLKLPKWLAYFIIDYFPSF